MHVPSSQTPCAWSPTWLSPLHPPPCSRHTPLGFVPLTSCCLFLRLLSCGRCMPGILNSVVVLCIIMRLCTSIHSVVCLDCISADVRGSVSHRRANRFTRWTSVRPPIFSNVLWVFCQNPMFLLLDHVFLYLIIFFTFISWGIVEDYLCGCVGLPQT